MPGGGSSLVILDPDFKVLTAKERSWMKSSWLLSRKLIFAASTLPRWKRLMRTKSLIPLLLRLRNQALISRRRAPDVQIGRVSVTWHLIVTFTTAMIALRSIPLVSATVIPKWLWYEGFTWLLDSIVVHNSLGSITANKQANSREQTFPLGLWTLPHSSSLYNFQVNRSSDGILSDLFFSSTNLPRKC